MSAAPQGTVSAVPSRRPLKLSQPKVRASVNPMSIYTDEVLKRYDAKSACMALCAAALRCKADDLFGDGPRAVGVRLTNCRNGCVGDHLAKPGYLGSARKCLASPKCEGFKACVSPLLPNLR